MKLNGSEIIVECLKEQGVDTIFGYPGGAILNVYDALYKHSDEITHILTSHEQGASHAADGYARATGKVGVCFATSGPGATNLVTGIATAYMDSVPMVAITCNVTVPLLGRDSFQEIDIAGVTMPITKHSYIVKNVKDLAKTLRNAFRIAKEGRPGPVLVDVTKDVTAAECEYTPRVPKPVDRITASIKEEDIDKAVTLIKKAKKPYVFVGGGAVISEASDELKKFVEKVDAPVCDSLMGKGAFDGSNERYTGMLGMHGTKTSNYGVSECDLLIVVGARFSDRVTGNTKKFAKNAKILQFDVDAAEINKNVRTDAHVLGDAKEILKRINDKLDNQDHSDWMEHIKSYKLDYPMRYNRDILNGPLIMEKIYEITNGDAIITTDVGQHQMWASQYLKLDATHRLVQSGGLGTMGFGLPSIGGKDSMSGTFNDIDVTPTLVSFAVDVAKVKDVITPEFKKAGSKLVWLRAPKDSYDLPDYSQIMDGYDKLHEDIKAGRVISAYAAEANGIAEAVSKMAFGNHLGVKIEHDVDPRDFFAPAWGDIVCEVPADKVGELQMSYRVIGEVTDKAAFEYGNVSIALDEALKTWDAALEDVFPTESAVKKEDRKRKKQPMRTVFTIQRRSTYASIK